MNIEEALKQAWVDAEKECRYPASMTQAEFVDFMFHRGYEFACDEKDAQHALRIALLDDCEDSNKTWNEIHLKDCEKISSLEEELKEQCHINGMGAQRELALITNVSELEDKLYHASREAQAVEYKLNSVIEKLKWQLNQFKHYGTDDCEHYGMCQGRISLFYHSKFCIECEPNDYRHYEELESMGKLLGGGEK